MGNATPPSQASSFLTPITSPFARASFRDLLFHWGYSEVPIVGHLCDFDGTHGLGTAFAALGVDPRSEAEGGSNRCFHVVHQYLDEGDGRAVGKQGYWVKGMRYTMTGAHFSIGINPVAGIVYFLSRRSAQEAAKLYWGRAAQSEELPGLRSSSDIAWGFWSRERWGELEGMRAFMSLMVVNVDTRRTIEEVLRIRYGKSSEGVLPWPGTTFGVDEIEGQALLGSPNGLAAGYFLAQHKQELGGNKVVDKVTVFRSERYGALPNLLFWVA